MLIPYAIETCRSVQCDAVMQNIWEQYSAFCWTESCELIIDNTRNEEYKNLTDVFVMYMHCIFYEVRTKYVISFTRVTLQRVNSIGVFMNWFSAVSFNGMDHSN
jgi:hypothetical protein